MLYQENFPSFVSCSNILLGNIAAITELLKVDNRTGHAYLFRMGSNRNRSVYAPRDSVLSPSLHVNFTRRLDNYCGCRPFRPVHEYNLVTGLLHILHTGNWAFIPIPISDGTLLILGFSERVCNNLVNKGVSFNQIKQRLITIDNGVSLKVWIGSKLLMNFLIIGNWNHFS